MITVSVLLKDFSPSVSSTSTQVSAIPTAASNTHSVYGCTSFFGWRTTIGGLMMHLCCAAKEEALTKNFDLIWNLITSSCRSVVEVSLSLQEELLQLAQQQHQRPKGRNASRIVLFSNKRIFSCSSWQQQRPSAASVSEPSSEFIRSLSVAEYHRLLNSFE